MLFHLPSSRCTAISTAMSIQEVLREAADDSPTARSKFAEFDRKLAEQASYLDELHQHVSVIEKAANGKKWRRLAVLTSDPI